MKGKQEHVIKTIKDFRLIGAVSKNNNASKPLIYKKAVNHAGQEVKEEKQFVVKKDFHHRQNAYLEKMAFDLFSLLGISVPKSYIIEDESAKKKLLHA